MADEKKTESKKAEPPKKQIQEFIEERKEFVSPEIDKIEPKKKDK